MFIYLLFLKFIFQNMEFWNERFISFLLCLLKNNLTIYNRHSFERNLPFHLCVFWRCSFCCSCPAMLLWCISVWISYYLFCCEFTGILNLWMVYFITSVKFSTRTSPNFASISFAFHSSSWAMIKNMLKLIDNHHISFPYLSFWLHVQHFFFQKTPENPLDIKEIKPVNLKGDQPWIFTGRTKPKPEAEAPVFWSSEANRWLVGKVPDAG